MFRQYHYLNIILGAGVRCYTTLYQNNLIAFTAVACTKMKSKYYRVSRLLGCQTINESVSVNG